MDHQYIFPGGHIPAISEVIPAIEKAGLRPQVKIMVGGAPVTRRWADEIGADGYAKDAMSAVDLARQLMAQKTNAIVAEPV